MTRSAEDFISRRAQGVDASGIRKVFDLAAKMKDPINLSIGLPDFDVPQVAKDAAIESIRRGDNRYTQTQGIAPLRERLRKDLSGEIGRDVGDVLITSGVSGGLFLAILATIDPGDEAVFLDPYFVMYKHLLAMAGGKPVIVDSYPDFRYDAERGLPSPAKLYDKTVLLRGFSKSHAMTGWRLGYAAGPEAVVAQMTKLQQYTFVCAPSPLQYAALAALDLDMSAAVAAYRTKRDIAFDTLSKKFEVAKP